MALARRERVLAFFAGVLLCSVLSSSLSVVIRKHDSLLSGTRSHSANPPFPHRARAHSSSIDLSWPWTLFRKAEAAASRNSTEVQASVLSNHWHSSNVSAQTSNIPIGSSSSSNKAEAGEVKVEKKVKAFAPRFSFWPWARSTSGDGDETAEKAATKLDDGQLPGEMETNSSNHRFSLWPWGQSTRAKVPDDSSAPIHPSRPIASSVSDGVGSATNDFEITISSSADGNAGAALVAGEGASNNNAPLARADDKGLEDVSGVGRFAWVWRLAGLFERVEHPADGAESPTKRELSDAASERRVEARDVKRAQPSAEKTSAIAERSGRPIGTSLRVSDIGTSRARNDGLRRKGTFTTILASVVGVLACALTAVGTARLFRARRVDTEAESLPLVVQDIEDGESSTDDEAQKVTGEKRFRRQNKLLVVEEEADAVRITVDEIVRDVVDEIMPEDAV